MDCAKGINFILTNGGRMADYKGLGKAIKADAARRSAFRPRPAPAARPSAYALIADEKTHIKMACGDNKAAFRVAILDPEVTVSQPRRSPRSPASTRSPTPSSRSSARSATRSRRCARAAAFRYLEPNFETVLRQPANLAARAAMQLGRIPRRHGDRERHARRLPQLRQPADGPLRHHARHRHRHDAAARHPLQCTGGRVACMPNWSRRPDWPMDQPAAEVLADRVAEL